MKVKAAGARVGGGGGVPWTLTLRRGYFGLLSLAPAPRSQPGLDRDVVLKARGAGGRATACVFFFFEGGGVKEMTQFLVFFFSCQERGRSPLPLFHTRAHARPQAPSFARSARVRRTEAPPRFFICPFVD